jgi:DNA-binding IclR family transcriptional regulator
VEDIISRIRSVRYTPKTLTNKEDLLKSLERVRKRGFAMDDEEIEMGVRCIGTPIFDESGFPIAALSMSGPTSQVRLQNAASIAERLIHCCSDVSNSLHLHRKRRAQILSNYLQSCDN